MAITYTKFCTHVATSLIAPVIYYMYNGVLQYLMHLANHLAMGTSQYE